MLVAVKEKKPGTKIPFESSEFSTSLITSFNHLEKKEKARFASTKTKNRREKFPPNIRNKKKKKIYKFSLKLDYTIGPPANEVLRKWSEIRLTHMRDGWPVFPPRLSTTVADKWMSVGEHVTGDPSVAPPLSFHSLFLSSALYRRHILPQHKWLLALPSSSSVFTCTFRWLYEVRTTRPKLDAGRLRLRFSFIHLFFPRDRANNCRFLLFFYSLKFVPRELPVLDTTTVRRDYYVICT